MKDLRPGFSKDQQQTIVKAEVKWPEVLTSNVRQLARDNYAWYRFNPSDKEYAIICSSSPECTVFGKITIILEGRKTFIPFCSSFLFTCIRSSKIKNEIEWSVSMN